MYVNMSAFEEVFGGWNSHTIFTWNVSPTIEAAELNTNGPAPASCFSNVFAAPDMSRWPTTKLRGGESWGCKFVTFYCTKFLRNLCAIYKVVVGKLGSNRHWKKIPVNWLKQVSQPKE